jgi:RNA polymerase sigma factor for flagellar operon FliA
VKRNLELPEAEVREAAQAEPRVDQPEQELALWREYRATGDARLRNRLVLTYAPLVRYLAYKRARELPRELEIDDLLSAGLEALIGSIDRFDPDKGATLRQHVCTRAHGALADELRRRDWVPRSLRRFQRDAKRASERLTAVHGRPPRSHELADALGMGDEDLRARQSSLRSADVRSLNEVIGDGESGEVELVETLASDDSGADPVRAVISAERGQWLNQAIERLPERYRQIAVLRYAEELTLQEIAEILGVPDARVSQLESRVKARLRTQLMGTVVEPSGV